jgi:hypothetical protein
MHLHDKYFQEKKKIDLFIKKISDEVNNLETNQKVFIRNQLVLLNIMCLNENFKMTDEIKRCL